MPAINEKERSVLFYKRMILVVILLTITVLAVIAVVQGVQIHKIKLGNESRAAQNAEQAETIERQTKQLEEQKAEAEQELTTLLCQIPNIPYDEVPEGSCAEDNIVVKSNQKECDGTDTVGTWTANPANG